MSKSIRTGRTLKLIATVLAGAALTGCSLMHDDLDPCAVKPETYTSVKFAYDYNTQEADLFSGHVGTVSVYVFDKDGKFVADAERCNSLHAGALTSPDFQIDFPTEVLKPGNSYTVYAVAHANPGGYEASLRTPGFRRLTEAGSGLGVEDFALRLDRDENGAVPHAGVQLDTLWTSLRPCVLDIPEEKIPEEGDPQEPDHYISATVPLMRVTNHVAITFWLADFPSDIDPSDFDISIVSPEGNGHLDLTGTLRDDNALTFNPYKISRVSRSTGEACVRADFGISRMMLDSDMALVIRNRATGLETRIGNLPQTLAKGNDAFSGKGWNAQEYLDREYDYSIEFPVEGDVPKWVQVNVAILSWHRIYQNVDL